MAAALHPFPVQGEFPEVLKNCHIKRYSYKRRRRLSDKGYNIYDFANILRHIVHRSRTGYVRFNKEKFLRYFGQDAIYGHLRYMRLHPQQFGLVILDQGRYTTPEERKDNLFHFYNWSIIVTTLNRFVFGRMPFTLTACGRKLHVRLFQRMKDMGMHGLSILKDRLIRSNMGYISSYGRKEEEIRDFPAENGEQEGAKPPIQYEMPEMLAGLAKISAQIARLEASTSAKEAFGGRALATKRGFDENHYDPLRRRQEATGFVFPWELRVTPPIDPEDEGEGNLE